MSCVLLRENTMTFFVPYSLLLIAIPEREIFISNITDLGQPHSVSLKGGDLDSSMALGRIKYYEHHTRLGKKA